MLTQNSSKLKHLVYLPPMASTAFILLTVTDPDVLHSYTTTETPPQQAETEEFFSCLPTRAIET